jgi:hypothetical protein
MSSPIMPQAALTVPPVSAMPVAVQRYALTGEAPSPLRRDLVTAMNQLPRWYYGGLALVSGWLAYKAYVEWKKTQPRA